jgi:peptide deformylase
MLSPLATPIAWGSGTCHPTNQASFYCTRISSDRGLASLASTLGLSTTSPYNDVLSYFTENRRVQIVKYPHPTLRHKSKPLKRVDRELKQIIGEMFELMYSNQGIGLASNQVNLPYRLFVMNVKGDPAEEGEARVFINPVITRKNGSAEAQEGCLSFPEIWAPVRRPEKIVVSAYGIDGQEFTYEMDGLYARAVQHEIDHLDGVVFIDRLSQANQLAVREDLDELIREFESSQRLGALETDEQIAARLEELEAART